MINSIIFWREATPAIGHFLRYTLEFVRWMLNELDKINMFGVKVIVYTVSLMGVAWLWGYSAGEKSKGSE
jgi:hypothetical protein